MNPNAFVNPPSEYRLLPFWMWNGTIEEGEIVRQIREMSEKGIGGFCLSVGPGLRTPYLSQVWFDRVKIALNAAAECGLKVWLHDEYRYPGGVNSSQVALGNPQYIAQQLTFRETVVQGGQQVDMELPWAPVLLAIAVPLRRDRSLWEDAHDIRSYLGLNHQDAVFSANQAIPTYHPHVYTTLNPTRRLYWKAPTGRWRVLVFLQEPATSASYPGFHIDSFNPEATSQLQQLTQQPYIDQAGDHVGKTLIGMLTGETHTPTNRLPWSPVLPAFFQARHGYAITPCLPALITSFGPNTARIRYNYYQALGELLQKNHSNQHAQWCKNHGLHYASNVPAPRNAHRAGVPIPGARAGNEKSGAEQAKGYAHNPTAYRQSPMFASSLSVQTGAERVLNTCFQQTGWSLTLQDMKTQLDLQGLEGANLFAPQSFFYTLDGLRKHAAPPSLFHQNPYWKHFRLLSDYAGRLSYALSQGQPVADIALLEPVTSMWTHLAHPDQDWAYVGNDSEEQMLVQRMISDWTYIIKALQNMRRPFDFLDPALFGQAKIVDRQIHIGKAKYPVIIVPPIANLEREAFDFLREFINAGGQVIALGLLPIEDIQEGPSVVDAFCRLTDMEPGRMIRDYTGHELGVHLVQRNGFYLIRTGGAVAKNRGADMLRTILDETLPRRIHIQTDEKHQHAIRYHQRTQGKQNSYFIANTTTNDVTARIQLTSPQNSKVERWDLETGKRTSLLAERAGNQLVLELPFERQQSHLLVVSEGKQDPVDAPIEALPIDIKGSWKIDLEEDNALRLANFRLQLDPQNRGVKQGWHKPDYADNRWANSSPKPIIEQMRDLPSGYVLPLELAETGTKTQVQLPLVCWYRVTFAADVVPTKLALVMDRNAIQGDYQIYINGSRLPSNAFRPTFRYDHANVTCAVGRRVNKGKNVLAVRVEVNNLNEGLVDALYLFGRHQVKSWRSRFLRLSAPPEKGPFNDLDALGLPFYAGTVAYTRDITFKTLPKTKQFELNLDKLLKDTDDIIEVQINGHALGVRAWGPYLWTGNTAWLKKGKNRITFRITNTLCRLLTGMTFQTRGHRLIPVKI